MSGLWRNNPDTPEGKYLVMRRNGTIPEWPWFVLSANDPAAPAALAAYAKRAQELGMDPEYVRDIAALVLDWLDYGPGPGATGRPDEPPTIIDDPATVELMRKGNSA